MSAAMSAGAAVVARLLTMLQDDAVLARAVHGIYDRPTPRASLPMLMIGAVTSSEWGTKDRAGCELRVEVRHGAMMQSDAMVADRIAATVAALRGVIPGWEIASARVMRSRQGYDRQGRWEETFDVRVRCLVDVET